MSRPLGTAQRPTARAAVVSRRALSSVDEMLSDARTPEALAAVLSQVLAGDALPALLRMLDRADEARSLARCSYVHANGFDKLVLRAGAHAQKLVLHVWWGEGRTADDDDIHNHRWDFATALLAGRYRATEFEVGEPGASGSLPVHEYRYESRRGGACYDLKALGRAGLTATRAVDLQAGSCYILRCDVIHRIEALGAAPTITVFAQGRPVQGTTRVFSPRPLPATGRVHAKRFTVGQYRAALRRVTEYLEPGRG